MELFILVNEPKLGENAQIWSIRIHSKSFSWPFTVKNYEQAYLDLLMNRRVNGQTDGRTDGRFYWYLKSWSAYQKHSKYKKSESCSVFQRSPCQLRVTGSLVPKFLGVSTNSSFFSSKVAIFPKVAIQSYFLGKTNCNFPPSCLVKSISV